MSEFQLFVDEFTEAVQDSLVGFSCGETTQGRYCTQWILGSDVLDSMKKGTKVWLFRKGDGEVVGYGSLGIVRWRWPLPDGDHTNNLYIPMLGIDKRFHGQPADREWRYSHQIVKHLIGVAEVFNQQSPKPVDWLLLMVAPDNQGAIRLYEQFGFELIPDVTRGPGHCVMKHRLSDVSS